MRPIRSVWLAAASALAFVVALALVVPGARAQTAFPARGAADDVSCALSLGPDLFVGGGFTSIGGTPAARIARWDGLAWQPLGTGLAAPRRAQVFALAAHGHYLYVGGVFRQAGGQPARNVARWNLLAQAWEPLGAGLDDWVSALAVYDDGSGPAVYAGGLFQASGAAPMRHLARWNELAGAWHPVAFGPDLGTNGPVQALLATTFGGVPSLFVGGEFSSVGGVPARNVARLAGAAWSPLPGLANDGTGGPVRALAVYDDGNGEALYAGGDFAGAGGNAAARVARWNGSGWSPLATGIGANDYEDVRSLTVFDLGGGPSLIVGGRFERAGTVQIADVAAAPLVNSSDDELGVPPSFVAVWDGNAWAGLGLAFDGPADAIVAHQAPGDLEPSLIAVGSFTRAGNQPVARITRFSSGSNAWGPLGTGNGPSHSVLALAGFDDGGGLDLYAGGDFTAAGNVKANGVARWDPSSPGGGWAALGGGMNGAVRALATADLGGGAALFAAGDFTQASGAPARFAARWDPIGASWQALGAPNAGLDGAVHALAAFDDGGGGGTALYAGGTFSRAGGASAERVARWNGATWTPLPGGGPDEEVFALAVYQGELVAGGVFTSAGGRTASAIARWDGTSWSPLGTGIEGEVHALAVVGGALYAGGDFTRVGVLTSPNLARWDGGAWHPVGGGLDGPVRSLAVDPGTGDLLVGGRFATAGAVSASNAARWNGAVWSELASGTDGTVHALHAHPGTLFLGGAFSNAAGVASSHLVGIANP